jgi:hypothetical protein
MSLATLRAKWDTLLSTKFPQLQARQSVYFTNKGRYFQGISTNNTPVDPAEAAPILTRKPADQAESWTDVGITMPATIPVRLWIDVYDGPNGKGWTLGAEVIIGTNTFRTCVDGAGNEVRAYDWRQVNLRT